MEQVMGLVSKASIILSFVFISLLISEQFGVVKKKSLFYHQLLQGIIFSIFIFIDMKTPYTTANNISYDAREVLLNLAAAVYGPIAATITFVFTFVVRLSRATPGTTVAVIGIVLVYLLELGFIYVLKNKKKEFDSYSLFLMSFLTNVISSACVLIMAVDEWRSSLNSAITFVVFYPFFTLIAFTVMRYIKNRAVLLTELSERDKILHQKNNELQYVNEELKRNELHFRTMFYHSSEAVFLIEKDEISDINLAARELLGYSNKEDVVGKALYLLMPEMQSEHQKSRDYVEEVFQNLESGKALKKEIMLLTKGEVELLLEAVFIEIELSDKKYIYMSARDIRERKEQEVEILYQAQHDALTKMANRQYFNEVLKKVISDERNYPIGFVMADINGLKLTNDVFGHSKGDELIIAISNALSQSCRSHDLVARIGGDEFCMILPNANEKAVCAVMQRIDKNLAQNKMDGMTLSLSMGFAVKESKEQDADAVLALADERMYQSKKNERQNNAKIFIEDMLNKLYEMAPNEKSTEEALISILTKLEIEQAHFKEIEAIIRYINIGKLITHQDDWKIPGHNLRNLHFPQKLIESSYIVLRNIGEIEGLKVAENFFNINEHWDGNGFALGTSGEEIPYSVRLFRLIFDAYYMKNVRNIPPEELQTAMEEQSGKKYDPQLIEQYLAKIIKLI